MSSHLWAAYFDDDLEKFRNLLGLSESRSGTYNGTRSGSMTPIGANISSPPQRQSTAAISALANFASESSKAALTRAQINARLPSNVIASPAAPATGVTLLHHAATSDKLDFVKALLDHGLVDLSL